MTVSPSKAVVEIHGHRGSRGTHPENTIPSFAEAAAAGADYFELDLQWSADDEPIVFHDPVLSSKLCLDPSGRAIAVPLALRRVAAKEILRYDAGGVVQEKFPKQRPIPGTRIPSFAEVLRWQQGVARIGVNVEIKMEAVEPADMPDPERCARQVVEMLRAHGLLDRAQVQSFDFRPLRTVKKLAPDLRLSCLFEERADFAAEALAVGAGIVGPFYEFLDGATVAACHAKGVKVIPWTVNEPAHWRELVAMGVDGLITDYPRELRAFLAKR